MTIPVIEDHPTDFVLSESAEPSRQKLDRIAKELGLITPSEASRRIVRQILQIAPTEMPVLIAGESGTGKEIVSKAIHQYSRRQDKPFVVVNSGAIAQGILESELFGHEKGSFTGAVSERKGYFESANTGTLFLDEIGEMPLETQVKLLRVLETGEFTRVGGSLVAQTDVRVIAATNRNLEEMIQKREFRKDLYYRLKGISISLPSLRDRKDDISLLVQFFAQKYAKKYHLEITGFTEEAMAVFKVYPWPGNIRELKNVVESLIALKHHQLIDAEDVRAVVSNYRGVDEWEDHMNLPVATHKTPSDAEFELLYNTLLFLKKDVTDIKRFLAARFGAMNVQGGLKTLPSTSPYARDKVVEPEMYNVEDGDDDEIIPIGEAEKLMIIKALRKFNGKRSMAAKSLGLSERTLYRKIKQYDLNI